MKKLIFITLLLIATFYTSCYQRRMIVIRNGATTVYKLKSNGKIDHIVNDSVIIINEK